MALVTGSTPALTPEAHQLKRRLLLQGAGFSLLLLSAFITSLYVGIALQRRDDQRAEVQQLAANAEAQLPLIAHETREAEGRAKFRPQHGLMRIDGLEQQRVQWFDRDARLLSQHGGLPLPALSQVPQPRSTWQRWPGGLALWQPVFAGSGMGSNVARPLGYVRVGLSDAPAQRDLLRLQRGLLLGALVTALAALLLARRVLRAAFAPLQAQITALEQFTADVSHELRIPLTALRTVLAAMPETLRRQPGLPWSELDGISRTMVDLLDDLLCLARLQQPTSCESFDLLELLDDLIRCYRPQAAARSVTLQLHPDPSLASQPCCGSAQQLLRLFTNLLSNAVRHSPVGGTVTLALTQAQRGVVHVDVIDQGPGIPEQWQQQVFERFWRGSDRGGQSGLGLAIARAIARRHGGELRLHLNEPGRCVLQVELPVAAGTS